MKTKSDWGKQIEEILNYRYPKECPHCNFKGSFSRPATGVAVHIRTKHPDKRFDKVDKLLSLMKQARQEGIEEAIEEVRKIVGDYQSFKIGTLGLEVKMCELVEKYEPKREGGKK
jgi:signal transduction histidine kinase